MGSPPTDDLDHDPDGDGIPVRPKGPKWSMIPAHVVFDKSLSNGQFRVFAAYAVYADSRTGDCWPSVPTIANQLGVSPRYVFRVLKKLLERGYITRTNRQRRYVGGKAVPVRAIIHDPELSKRIREYGESEDAT
jgi:hypothetical protein